MDCFQFKATPLLFLGTAAVKPEGAVGGARDIAEISASATIFFWAYALTQLPAGILVDILGPRRLAALGGFVTGAGAFGFAAAQNVGAALYARGVMAVGCAVVFVSLIRYVRSNWAERRVATVSGRWR